MNKWDKEYCTQFLDEVDYLANKGIKYVFVKRIDGVRNYKYTKTPELFEALAVFYKTII
ncbi:hypothetical protein EDC18_102396 [Natranaerovirga pectinivora]|uniref:Uncharacterized protein n=1 Tax=Natranaerovirga pectinivora TaxID=682400 RepID=A0A4V2V0J1_9FIRM|nr:hypothetical protein [Natranaerovirga pectinivora]TCT16377.1 hypothetical protein EDC18_102396 [Natranaerovirga pectinivora]